MTHFSPGIITPYSDPTVYAGTNSGDYELSEADYQTITFGTPTDPTEWIIGGWAKRESTGTNMILFGNSAQTDTFIYWSTSDGRINLRHDSAGNKFSSTSAYTSTDWQHILMSFNSGSEITATEKCRLWVDGTEDTGSNPSAIGDDFNAEMTNAAAHRWGRDDGNDDNYFDGLMTQGFVIDGKSIQGGDYAVADFYDSGPKGINALAPGGTNSCLLMYENGSDLGEDTWGSNDFTNTGVTQSSSVPS